MGKDNKRARMGPCCDTKKARGQYFTVSEVLQQFVFDHVRNKPARLLEPSFGAGHLLRKFLEYDPDYPMTCYEIDPSIPPVVSLGASKVVYGDFLAPGVGPSPATERFRTIIGNPPYVRQRGGTGTGAKNLYLRFVEACYRLLDDDGGEMVFIVPSDFLKQTRAAPILTEMAAHGAFTDFLFPHNERLFEGASIDVVVFRYQKGAALATAGTVRVNGREMVCRTDGGMITFREPERGLAGAEAEGAAGAAVGTTLGARFHVYVGMVSGKDHVYRMPFGNIEVLMDKDRLERFIFPETFPTGRRDIDDHLRAHKSELMGRRIRSFTEDNWYEWGAPRNLSSIRAHWGKPCIYVRNLTRQKEVAFLGQVGYFGGGLLCLVPRDGTGGEEADLAAVVRSLNVPEFQKEYVYAGRFRIGHRQLCAVAV